MTTTTTTTNQKPLYQQIIDYFCEKIVTGELKSGEKLPSIRKAAKLYDTSAITIIKAFQELEKDGMIVTYIGKGSYIAPNAVMAVIDRSRKKIEHNVRDLVRRSYELGYSRNDIVDLINHYWVR